MNSYYIAFLNGVKRIFLLPKLSLPIILTLGLTMGAVLSVVAISSALLLKPLQGVPNEDNIQALEFKLNMADNLSVSYWNMRQLANFATRFRELGKWAGINASERSNIKINGVTTYLTLYSASDSILDILGTQLLLGQSTYIESPEKFIWISESLWQTHYDRDQAVLGKQIVVDGESLIIAGVIEDLMAVSSRWKPVPQQLLKITDLNTLVGAPEDGQIRSDFASILLYNEDRSVPLPALHEIESWMQDYVTHSSADALAQSYLNAIRNIPKESASYDYRSLLLGDTKTLLLTLFVAVMGLLVMAILNLLNLFLAHYQNRTKEFAIQLTLGASLVKMRWLVFAENLPSFIVSVGLGLLTALWIIEALPLIAGDNLPLIDSIHIDTFTLLVAMLIMLVFSVLVSLLSLVNVNKTVLAENLTSSGKGLQMQTKQWLSKSLMVLQLCIASILLTASVLLAVQSYQAVYKDLGYDLGNHFMVHLEHKNSDFIERIRTQQTYQGSEIHQLHMALDESILSVIPNSHVIINSSPPLSSTFSVSLGSDPDDPSVQIMYENKHLSADYFKAFNIPFLAGNNLTPQQIEASAPLVIIDEKMAQVSFPNTDYADIIGQTLAAVGPSSDEEGAPNFIVNGIVANTVSRAGATSIDSMPAVYNTNLANDSSIFITVALPQGESFTKPDIAQIIETNHPEVVLIDVFSLHGMWLEQTASQRISLYIILGVTTLTLLLTVIGIAGLTQMATHHRLYELAIHMAMGAKQSRLVQFILTDAMVMLVFGLGLGFIISVLIYQAVQETLPLLPLLNWTTMGATDLGLIIVVILAIIIPAWRTIKADPLVALRQE